jgi:hypothetical protein
MLIQPKVAFCINVDGKPKTLFTVYEQEDEELILVIKSATFNGLLGSGPTAVRQLIE